MENRKILEVKNLKVILDGKTILENVSFDLNERETLMIIGPNGAGKSVLIKTIIGEIKKYEGEIKIKEGIKIGYLPQRFHLDTYLPITMKEFLELKPHRQYTLQEIAKLIDIPQNWFNKSLSLFSSGQLQKILLAWAIIDKPQLLLFDEPTENVDVVSQKSIYELLKGLQEELNFAMVIVSHDLSIVYRYATNVLCLNSRMICFGPPLQELNKEVLDKLYSNYSIYEHHHNHQKNKN